MAGAPGRIVAGIDEAGLGPILGPLTVGVVAMRLPSRDTQVWSALRRQVARSADRARGRLVVADSKRVFARTPSGHARLEATALAFLSCRSEGASGPNRPQTGLDLLRLAPDHLRPDPALLDRHPWYQALPEELPTWVPPEQLDEQGERLRGALQRRGLELLESVVRVVPAGELNASYDETDNKAVSTWVQAASLIRWIWARYSEERPYLVIDRQGGRQFYAGLLWELFPEGWIETLREGKGGCEYIVHEGGKAMDVLLVERAEDRCFPVALASGLATYTREICMGGFNRYFAGYQKELKPTAGYVTDGRRWLQDAAPALERAGIERRALVRER